MFAMAFIVFEEIVVGNRLNSNPGEPYAPNELVELKDPVEPNAPPAPPHLMDRVRGSGDCSPGVNHGDRSPGFLRPFRHCRGPTEGDAVSKPSFKF